MFRVEVQAYIGLINSVFYRVGVWHREDVPTVGELRLKFFYSVYYFLGVISVIGGTLGSKNLVELTISVEYSLMGIVSLVKLLYIIWRKKEIVDLLNRICVYLVEDDDTYTQVKYKLKILMRFIAVFFSLMYLCLFCIVLVLPFVGSEKTLCVSIAFPLDWKNSDSAYWTTIAFLFTQAFILSIAILLSAIIWYVMTNCGLRFDILGQQIKTMGTVRSFERIGIANGRKISDSERNNLYFRDLLECIDSHTHLKELTNELDSFLSELLVVQLTTSALCICGSVYSIAFTRDDSLVGYLTYMSDLLYNFFDIFMIMKFGNEIESASDRLSCCLFESDWMDLPQSTKKIILIFGEVLTKPHQLVVLKLYPLNLGTFMRILNSAYSSFNILQNFK